jgi:hypothetical protein
MSDSLLRRAAARGSLPLVVGRRILGLKALERC